MQWNSHIDQRLRDRWNFYKHECFRTYWCGRSQSVSRDVLKPEEVSKGEVALAAQHGGVPLPQVGHGHGVQAPHLGRVRGRERQRQREREGEREREREGRGD